MTKEAQILETSGHCIFSDEIRVEMNGKEMLIGIYHSDLIVDQFPARLERLCVTAYVKTPISAPIKSFQIFTEMPDKDNVIEQPQIDLGMDVRDPSEDATYYLLKQSFVISPLELKSQGTLKVKAKTDAGLVHLGSLRIKAANADAPVPQIGDILGPVFQYAKKRGMLSEELQYEMARDVLELIASQLKGLPPVDATDVIVPIGDNKFKIYFGSNFNSADDYTITIDSVSPETSKMIILDSNAFSAVVEFSPAEIPVTDFSFNVHPKT